MHGKDLHDYLYSGSGGARGKKFKVPKERE